MNFYFSRKEEIDMKKKIFAVALVTIIAVMAIAGSSLAWLQDKTETVKNTFTEGKVDIELTETGATNNEKSYKMVPGDELAKDPTVTVKAGSEKCYLFVKVDKVNDVDTFLIYAIDSAWTALGTAYPGVYYMIVDADDEDQEFSVLKGDKVTVKTDVDMDNMNALTASGKYPRLDFTAYVVQYANIAATADPVAAWGLIGNN